MKKVVITGATGAIGMALVKKCIEEGIEVLVLCHRNSNRIKQIPRDQHVKIILCNLDEMSSFDIGNKRYDVFYHFAWEATWGDDRNDVFLQSKNINYTLEAVKLAFRLGCKRFIGAGSQAEYGRTSDVLRPTTSTFPENGYGMAKLCAGQMSHLLCSQHGMDSIWVRVLSVYGPYDGMNTMVSFVIRKLLKNEQVLLTKGEQVWDYLYSEDAAEAFFLVGRKGIAGKNYVLSGGEKRRLIDYVEVIKNKIDEKRELGYGEIPYSPQQVMYLHGDISELKEDTGFVPRVSFDDGIEATINWMKLNDTEK